MTPTNNNGLWMGAPGAVQLVAREGDAAPGTPDGVTFANLSGRRLNQHGQVAFEGTLSGPGVTTDNDPVNPKSSIPDEVVVTVRNINDPPSCDLAPASLDGLWPPNHKMSPVGIDGVMDADSDYSAITLSITGVTQDEPVNGDGDGDSSPDAVVLAGDPDDTVLIQAERAANGDGRVNFVSFSASDGFDSCSGSVHVVVPTSRKSAAIDSGQSHDSTLQ